MARYAGMNVTWQGVQAFETYDTGRALMKEIGGLLKQTGSLPASRAPAAAWPLRYR